MTKKEEITGRILAVDDEPRNLKLIEAMLKPIGHEVIPANDGVSAIEIAKTEDIDVILLDVMMPGMNGFATASELKRNEKTSTVPIVMVTALNDTTDRIEALNVGADDFLAKPVDVNELRARVSSLVKVKLFYDQQKNYQRSLEIEVEKQTKQLRRAYDQIKESSLDTILRLTKASEFKDEDTGAHINRMSNYAAIIAETMGLNPKTVETILYASPMHDIGKVGIPDIILLKPGKLNEPEWKIMKQHTVFGARILEKADTPLLKMAGIIALNHHEKWDGTGYPRGIKGKKIPLAARIVTISDVFDALVSKRPYKEAFTLEKTFSIIDEMNGSTFDPEITAAFYASKDKILEIKDLYQDDDVSILKKLHDSLEESSTEYEQT